MFELSRATLVTDVRREKPSPGAARAAAKTPATARAGVGAELGDSDSLPPSDTDSLPPSDSDHHTYRTPKTASPRIVAMHKAPSPRRAVIHSVSP